MSGEAAIHLARSDGGLGKWWQQRWRDMMDWKDSSGVKKKKGIFGEGFGIGGEEKKERGRKPYILDSKIKWILVLFAKTCNSGLQLCWGVGGPRGE